MSRTFSGSAVGFALLIASAAPGFACGLSNYCPPAIQSQPQPVFIPPIVMQQIETASAPISLPGGAPPASDDGSDGTASAAPYAEGGIASLASLDSGIADWTAIAPGEDFSHQPPLGITYVGKTAPAPHARPAPPKTEVQVGLYLTMEVDAPLVQKGVPGVNEPFLGSGNRALWFASIANE